MEAVQEFLDAFVNECVMRYVVLPVLQLCRRREFPMQKQVCGLQIRGFLRQLLDRVAPVTQDPLVAVNISDMADARSRVVISRVVADDPKIFGMHLDLPQVHRPDSVVRDGEFVGFPGAVVGDGYRVAAGNAGFGSFWSRRGERRVHTEKLTRSGQRAAAMTITFTPNQKP